jgi:hypothetical protein
MSKDPQTEKILEEGEIYSSLLSDLLEETTSSETVSSFTIGEKKMKLENAEVEELHLLTIVLNAASQHSLGLLEESSTEKKINNPGSGGTLPPTTRDENDKTKVEKSKSIWFLNGEPRLSPNFLASNPPYPHLRPSKLPFIDHYPLSLSELKKNKQTKSLKKLSFHLPKKRKYSHLKFTKHRTSKIPGWKKVSHYTPNILNHFKHKTLLFSFTHSEVNLHLTTSSLDKVPVNVKNTVNIQITNSVKPRIKNLRIDIN